MHAGTRRCSSEHLHVSFFLNTHHLEKTRPYLWSWWKAGLCSWLGLAASITQGEVQVPCGSLCTCHPNFISVCSKWKPQLLQQHCCSFSQAFRDFSVLWNLGRPPWCGCKLIFLSNQLAKQGIVQVLNLVPGTAPQAGRGITAQCCSRASSELQSISRWMEGCHSAAGRDWGWEESSGVLPAAPKDTSAFSLDCCSFSRRAAFHEI